MENTTFFSTEDFARSWCRSLHGGCEPVSVPVVGSGSPRQMYFIKVPSRYWSHHIASVDFADFCLSPGWTEELSVSTVDKILSHLRGLRTRSLVWKVRFDHQPLAQALSALGLHHRRIPIHVLDLSGNYERVFQSYHSTTRNHVRKARRRGLLIRKTSEHRDVMTYHLLYVRFALEKGWQFTYPAELTTELLRLDCTSRLFVAEHEGRIVGGALFIRDGNSVFYLHGASDRRYSQLFASSALIDAGVQWGCEVEAEFVNLGNSGSNTSLAEFKSSWGACIERNWQFTWVNPVWRRASRIKSGVRTLRRPSMKTTTVASTSQPVSTAVARGMPWSERSNLGELSAVLYAGGSQRKNLMMHGASIVGAESVLSLIRKDKLKRPVLLDYGCGTGRMIRFFHTHGCMVLGTDITPEMLEAVHQHGLPADARLWVTDGPSIPLESHSLDVVWVCGVLKYTLFPPGSRCLHRCLDSYGDHGAILPTYSAIAKEMFRVLKPGGFVANVEMWVDAPPDVFTPAFEAAGFLTERVAVLRRYEGHVERLCEWRDDYNLAPRLVLFLGKICARLRLYCDNPSWRGGAFQDYLFVWRKPDTDQSASC